jgi:hypothetical protein
VADDSMKVTIDGQTFDVNDFEGRELVAAERAFNISLFAELDRGSATGVYALLFIIKRRSNPEFTVDDALSLPLGTFESMVDLQAETPAPPTNRAQRRAAPKRAKQTA